MVLGQFFCQFTGSTAQTHCARRPQLVSKKFLKKFSQEQIFVSWCLITKIAKISASQKFPTIRYPPKIGPPSKMSPLSFFKKVIANCAIILKVHPPVQTIANKKH